MGHYDLIYAFLFVIRNSGQQSIKNNTYWRGDFY